MSTKKTEAQKLADDMARLLANHDKQNKLGGLGMYILDDDHQPHPASTLEWARWYETADRRVALSETELHEVSTVFLGIDHGWHADSPPILFETMVFARERGGDGRLGEDLGLMDRYATWDEALKGHNDILREVSKLERKATEKMKSLQSPPERNKA